MNTGRSDPGATPVDVDNSVRASGGDSRRSHFGLAGSVDHCVVVRDAPAQQFAFQRPGGVAARRRRARRAGRRGAGHACDDRCASYGRGSYVAHRVFRVVGQVARTGARVVRHQSGAPGRHRQLSRAGGRVPRRMAVATSWLCAKSRRRLSVEREMLQLPLRRRPKAFRSKRGRNPWSMVAVGL